MQGTIQNLNNLIHSRKHGPVETYFYRKIVEAIKAAGLGTPYQVTKISPLTSTQFSMWKAGANGQMASGRKGRDPSDTDLQALSEVPGLGVDLLTLQIWRFMSQSGLDESDLPSIENAIQKEKKKRGIK